MLPNIKRLCFGGVNCYLVKTNGRFTLIDTGFPRHSAVIERELDQAGCRPGDLSLIVLTHGDSDHSGNAAVLRERYGAKIAIHAGERQVVEQGDMLLSRKHRPLLNRIILPFFRLSESDRFVPDLTVEDSTRLSAHGLDATILHLPGHTIGSIGILTAAGDLFCGDLLTHNGQPKLDSFMDDRQAAKASLAKLQCLPINTVYPGHGQPFSMRALQGTPDNGQRN